MTRKILILIAIITWSVAGVQLARYLVDVETRLAAADRV